MGIAVTQLQYCLVAQVWVASGRGQAESEVSTLAVHARLEQPLARAFIFRLGGPGPPVRARCDRLSAVGAIPTNVSYAKPPSLYLPKNHAQIF